MHHRDCRRYRLEGLHVYKRNPKETWVHFLCRLQRYSMAAQTPNTVMDNQPIPPLMFLTPDEQKALAVCLIQRNLMTAVAVEVLLPQRKPRRKRRVWSWPYLQRRTQYGHYDTLMDELFQENPDLYKNFTRMDRDMFNNIVEACGDRRKTGETSARLSLKYTPSAAPVSWWEKMVAPPTYVISVASPLAPLSQRLGSAGRLSPRQAS